MLRFLLSLVCIFSVAYPSLAQSGDSLIVSGRQMLQAGENAGDLDAMYAARATFERALADTGLVAWGSLLYRFGRLPHCRPIRGRKQRSL